VEPDGPGYGASYSGGFGPEKIYCCKTAYKVIRDLQKRCDDCNDAVPCSQDMETKWCPTYLEKYRNMRDEVCRTTTTTTTTVTTTTTTGAPTTAPPTTTTATTTIEETTTKETEEAKEHRLQWCIDMCEEMAQNDKCKDPNACKKFCKDVEPKFAEMREV